MPSDTPGPRRMPWEEFRRRFVDAAERVIEVGRLMPDAPDDLRADLSRTLADLLGWPLGEDLAAALRHPPYVCGCGALYRSALPKTMCHECEMKASRAALEAEIEAKVRAELAQGGSTT